AASYERVKARKVESGRRASIAANGTEPGRVRVALASARPMASGTVATIELRFTDTPPATTPVLASARVDP
ncbi:MAG: hypothetical protein ABIR79_20070, partial [Candidatus Binatia bacterium]